MAKKPMSADHKAALAEGRRQGHAVSAYLNALEAHKPKRGRKRTPESIQKKLSSISDEMSSASGSRKLELMQERRDLEAELQARDNNQDLAQLEADFIEVAAAYSDRKGIEYATWREFGVPAATLKAAGVSRAKS